MLPLPLPRPAVPPTADELADAVDLVREFGRHAGRTWYAGVVPVPARGCIVVHRRPHPDFDAAVLALVGDRVPVELWPARFTRDELVDVEETVWGLDEVLDIEAVVRPADGSGLLVHVGGSVSRAQVELDRVALGVAVALPPRDGALAR